MDATVKRAAKSKRPSKIRDNLVYAAVWLACFAPLVWLAWRAFSGDLGANPIETLIRQIGVWGLRLLLVGLAVTPAARILKKPRLVRFRRTIGLFAFSYICLHLMTYIGVDLFFDWGQLWKDILKRPFITLGMLAFVLLIPLALTSTNGMIRRLGRATWQRLHWLIYLIVPAGRGPLLPAGEGRSPAAAGLCGDPDGADAVAVLGRLAAEGAVLEQLRVRIPCLIPLPPPAELRPAAAPRPGPSGSAARVSTVNDASSPAGVRACPGQRKAVIVWPGATFTGWVSSVKPWVAFGSASM
jgi:sulfoxide reductase heme-binding subunit YedZ